MGQRTRQVLVYLAGLWTILFLASTLILGLRLLEESTAARAEAIARADIVATQGAAVLDARLARLEPIAERLAERLSTGEVEVADLDTHLWEVIGAHPYLFGVAVVFTPHAADPEQRLFAPYLVRRDGFYELVQVEAFYDYTEAPWYVFFLDEGPGWMEPFYGEASRTWIAVYCHPFTLPDRPSPSGLACVDYSLDDVRDLVAELQLGETGYAFVLSAEGALVSYPLGRYVRAELTLAELGVLREDPDLLLLQQRVLHEARGTMRVVSPATGLATWKVFEPIPTTDWSLVVAFLEAELFLPPEALIRLQIPVTVSAMGFLAGLVFLWMAWRRRPETSLWAISVLLSLSFLVATLFIWSMERDRPGWEDPDLVPLVEPTGLEALLDAHAESSRRARLPPPLHVPTGVIVRHVAFQTAHELVISGVAWQRFGPETAHLTPGIRFPDAVPRLDVLEEIYRQDVGDEVVIGWFFKTTIQQPVDQRGYPIDTRTIGLRLWPAELDAPVVLVPDLSAYPVLAPAARPGLIEDFRIPGWTTRSAFFAYQQLDYRADLGLPRGPLAHEHPELTLNLVATRHLATAFVANFIPLAVATAILFGMLVIDTRDRSRAEAFGFVPLGILAAASAIFFVMLLAHVQVRADVLTPQVVYLELFYFGAYVLILLVSVNALLLASPFDIRFIEYRDNLLPKILFWPVSLCVTFLMTAWVFW